VTVNIDRVISVTQLISLVSGLTYFAVEMGRREQMLTDTSGRVSELRAIVQDLTKAQITATTKDSAHDRELDQLRSRIERLEEPRRTP